MIFRDGFCMVDTHGLPLSVVLEECRAHGVTFDSAAFARDAQAAGWRNHKILSVVREAVVDVEGPDGWERFCDKVLADNASARARSA